MPPSRRPLTRAHAKTNAAVKSASTVPNEVSTVTAKTAGQKAPAPKALQKRKRSATVPENNHPEPDILTAPRRSRRIAGKFPEPSPEVESQAQLQTSKPLRQLGRTSLSKTTGKQASSNHQLARAKIPPAAKNKKPTNRVPKTQLTYQRAAEEEPAPAKDQTRRHHSENKQKRQNRWPSESGVSSWLESVDVRTEDPLPRIRPEQQPSPFPSISDPIGTPNSTSSFTMDSTRSQDNATEKSKKSAKPSFYDLLEGRTVEIEKGSAYKGETWDKLAADLKKSIEQCIPIHIPAEHEQVASYIEILESVRDELLAIRQRETPGHNVYSIIEKGRLEMEKCLPPLNLFSIITEAFKQDMEQAMRSNESVLQRTILPSALDRYHLEEELDYNFESVWTSNNQLRLKVKNEGDDTNTKPKPDLSVYFKKSAIIEGLEIHDKVPKVLTQCVKPDSDEHRYFPFFFIEAKKADDALREARLKNLNSASQALNNMLQVMSRAGMKEVFYDRVRAFTAVMNAAKIEIRIHRAIEPSSATGRPIYVFDEMYTHDPYTRDKLSSTIRTIFRMYAVPVLLRVLKRAYRQLAGRSDLNGPQQMEIERSEVENIENGANGSNGAQPPESRKRKSPEPQDPSKKARTAENGIIQTTGTSYCMSTMQVSAE